MTATRDIGTWTQSAHAFVRDRERWHWAESLPWIAAVAAFFVFPDYLALGTQIIIAILFALSLDLILGYAGIITLGVGPVPTVAVPVPRAREKPSSQM